MNKRNILTFMAAALTLAACQNEEIPQAGEETQAQFTTNLKQRVQSRMADDRWDTNDQIGIFTLNDEQQGELLPDGSAAPSNLRLNMKYYTEDGSMWKSDAPFYFKNPTAPTVKFTAYYPWTENAKIEGMKVEGEKITGTIAVDVSDQSAAAQKTYDYLYADKDAPAESSPKTPQGSKDAPQVKFQFAHSMTKVVIKLQADPAGSTTLEDVKALTPTLKSLIGKGTFNLADGKVTAADFEDEGAVKDLTLANKTESGDAVSYTAILPPQTTQDNTAQKAPEIALSNDGGDNYRSAKILTNKELAAGTCYTVTITVKKMALVVEESDITDWTPGAGDSQDAVLQ